jgi:hypothetical protein
MRLTAIIALPLIAVGLMGATDPPAPWAKPYAGAWTLSGVSEGDPVCGLTLGQDPVIGGASISVSATCRRNYPLEDVAGWTLSGKSIRLIDAVRAKVLNLEPAADKSYMGTFPDGRAVSLERGPPDRPKSFRALVEDEATFTLSGPDNAGACGFSLTAKTATTGLADQQGECAKPWKGRGWKTYVLAGDMLSFRDKAGATILTLKRADAFTFMAEDKAAPVFFGPGAVIGQ